MAYQRRTGGNPSDSGNDPKRPRRRPATTPEGRENQMVSLASDLAEEQLRSGTASAQVITHYLKLGSSRELLEQERLRGENALLAAKREAMESQQRMEDGYVRVIAALRSYNGFDPEEEEYG